MPGADEPKPAVLGRTEHDITVTEKTESPSYLTGIERRDIAADEHDRTWRARPEHAQHPNAKIAAALPDGFDYSAAMSDVVASPVRRQCDPQTPATVPCQTAKQPRDHQPLETHCRNIADLAREPPLPRSETRCARKED